MRRASAVGQPLAGLKKILVICSKSRSVRHPSSSYCSLLLYWYLLVGILNVLSAIVCRYIAGIHGPPVPHLLYQTEEHLKRLASERTLVSCQLLARQVVSSVRTDDGSNSKKRPMLAVMPELAQEDASKTVELQQSSSQIPEVAICRVTYRPSFFQLFSTDVAQSLVLSGNASVSSSVLGQQQSASQVSTIRDSSQRLDDLRDDLKYLDRLTKAEFEAAAKSLGMWSVREVREAKRDVMDEVEFQTKATAIQKLWRWIRGG